jgi:RNA polymerase sigma-70 factor (ECF subfamily)
VSEPVGQLSLSDAEIITLLQERPTIGVAALYDRYGRLVFSVALRVVHDASTAEEITQDVFVRCWRSVNQYRADQSSLATWLVTITRNRAVDELRSRRGQASRREVSDALLGFVAADSTLDDVLVRTEVREALAALPEAQREVIELVFWGGLTRREVADQLQLPLGTVHTRLRLAMEKLREALGRWFGEP